MACLSVHLVRCQRATQGQVPAESKATLQPTSPPIWTPGNVVRSPRIPATMNPGSHKKSELRLFSGPPAIQSQNGRPWMPPPSPAPPASQLASNKTLMQESNGDSFYSSALRPIAAPFESSNAAIPGPVQDPEFLKELPNQSSKEDLLPLPLSPIRPELRSPSEQTSAPEQLPEPVGNIAPESDDLLETRERQSQPYPKPDFSTPAERVVPLPVQRAPESFKGFVPESPGDWNLPEPRRQFPLPQVQQPVPSSPQPTPYPSGMQSAPMYSADGQLIPPLSGNAHRSGTGIAMTPTYQFQSAFPASHDIRTTPAIHAPLQDRLSDRHWQFKLQNQLPYSRDANRYMEGDLCEVPFQPTDFAPNPFVPQPLDACKEIATYYGKLPVDVQRPWVEWWRPFYTGGMYEPGVPVFSDVNLLTPSFLVYGDYRTGVGLHRDNGNDVRSWAHRLNLDMDLRLTGTERFHMFAGPLDHNGRFTRLDFSNNDVDFEEELDFQPETAFFEGDLGAITGSYLGVDAPFDLPFTFGLVPLLYQNGIWMEDAIVGFALGAPWRHSKALNISNFEATFFAGFNQVTSPAFQNDNNAGRVYGTAWFLEAYGGYIEADYAYLEDIDDLGRSYHNAAIAYTRRYFGRISNSVRLIGNAGQSGPAIDRSADGGLLIVESSLISSQPSNVVPYWNCFVGSGRPQSVARAANAGGILRNIGINFETDGLTGYPTLNATGSNSYGGAVGVNMLSADFRRQWIVEFASLDTYGNPALSAAAGPEYALGTRYQQAINNRCLWRADLMNGWFDNAPDIYGTRLEFRWKF
jgi:hypothetical protein